MTMATTNAIYGDVLLDALAGIIVLVALVRIWTTPACLWTHGRLSKLAWAVLAIWLTLTVDSVAFPLGAGVAIWHTHRLAKTPLGPSEPEPLPFAEGVREGASPESPSRGDRDGRWDGRS